jgi:hypothetical protein
MHLCASGWVARALSGPGEGAVATVGSWGDLPVFKTLFLW